MNRIFWNSKQKTSNNKHVQQTLKLDKGGGGSKVGKFMKLKAKSTAFHPFSVYYCGVAWELGPIFIAILHYDLLVL